MKINLAAVGVALVLLSALSCSRVEGHQRLPAAGADLESGATGSVAATTTAVGSDNVTREEAISIASEPLQPQLVQRARIEATLLGWYWEVVFDDLNATSDELKPFPLDSISVPPRPETGLFGCSRSVSDEDPWAGKTWQAIIVKVNAATGQQTGFSMREKLPGTPGSPMSETQAIETARKELNSALATEGVDIAWVPDGSVRASLEVGRWKVVFWDDDNPQHRLEVSFDAETGKDIAIARG